MQILLSSNTYITLTSNITDSQTTIPVSSVSSLPTINVSNNEYFYLDIVNEAGDYETLKITNISGLNLISIRAQGGTTAKAFTSGSPCGLRIGKAVIDDLIIAIDDKLPLSGGSLTNFLSLHANPEQSYHAVTKQYVDNLKSGLDPKDSVRAATTVNINLSGQQTVDGVNLQVGDRVLVKNQANPALNGIYIVNISTWLRAVDADSNSKVNSGLYVFVEEGTINNNSGWILSTDGVIDLGTTNLTFVQFSGLGQVIAGTGLIKTGNQLDLNINEVLASIKTVDGSTSGLDADLLDGNDSTYFAVASDLSTHISNNAVHITSAQNDLLDSISTSATELNYLTGVTSNVQTQLNNKLNSSSYTAADVLSKISSVDGTGSGLDADLLDGQDGSYYATASDLSTHQSDNTVHITSAQNTWIDSITATSTEVNYLSGTTSTIQTQLDNKQNIISTGTTSQYYRGDKTWATLDKTSVGLSNVENTALSTWAGSTSLTTAGDLNVTSLVVSGNFTVNGTTTTINATTITVDDKNLELGSVTIPSNATADGGGITLKGTTDKTIIWDNANANWTSSENWNLASGKSFKINNVDVLNSTTLGSSIVNSSLTSVGTLTNLTVTNTITGSISGNAATVTNGVYTTDSYSDPSWLTLSKSKVGLSNVENTALSTWTGSSNITTIGTITTGTWNGTTISIAKGGTGQTTASAAFNALSPITTLGDIIYGSSANTSSRLAGNTTSTKQFLSQTGTGTVSAAPSWSAVTKSDVGLSNVENTALSTWTGSSNITTIGTITTGTWNGVVIAGQYGGTGVANTGKTITLGGNLTTSGAFATTLTVTGATNVTLPTSGTLAANNQTFYIGTTQVAINQASGTLALAGITVNANVITSGTISTARLGSGTADSTTYLRGDNTWQTISSGGVTLSDDTSTNATRYVTLSSVTSGSWSTGSVSSTKLYFNPSTGTLSATNFNSLSDISLKTNINTITNGLEVINQINPVSFNWKDNGIQSYGVIAQEIEKILPSVVDTNDFKSVNYTNLIAFLISAVQELSIKVKSLEGG